MNRLTDRLRYTLEHGRRLDPPLTWWVVAAALSLVGLALIIQAWRLGT